MGYPQPTIQQQNTATVAETDMDLELVAKAVGGIGAVILAFRHFSGLSARGRDLSEIEQTVRIFNELPDDIEGKAFVKNRLIFIINEGFNHERLSAKEQLRDQAINVVIALAMVATTVILVVHNSEWSILTAIVAWAYFQVAFGSSTKPKAQSTKKEP